MALDLTWQSLPAYITVALTLVLGLALLWLDFHKRANRIFALLLMSRGLALLLGLLRSSATTLPEVEFYHRLTPYFAIAQVPAILYFLAVYPRPRTWFGRSPLGGWVLLALTLVAELAYALDHSLYGTYAVGEGLRFLVIHRSLDLYWTGFGPLILLGTLSAPLTCLAALIMARDYLRERPGGGRFSIVLIVAGLSLSGLFFGTQYLIEAAFMVPEAADYPWMPWGWGFLIPVLTAPLALAAVVTVWLGAARTPHRSDDRQAHRMLLAAPLPVLCALVLGFSPTRSAFDEPLALFALGIWRLVMPLLVSYALLRYQLFDLDVKARLTIQHGTVIAILGVAFFFGSELAEAAVSERAGNLAGLTAAGLLTLAIKPLERMSGRLAARLMPSARPLHELSERERHAMYNDQFAMALQDGRLTANERRMLRQLQEKLGLEANVTAAAAPPAAVRRRKSSA